MTKLATKRILLGLGIFFMTFIFKSGVAFSNIEKITLPTQNDSHVSLRVEAHLLDRQKLPNPYYWYSGAFDQSLRYHLVFPNIEFIHLEKNPKSNTPNVLYGDIKKAKKQNGYTIEYDFTGEVYRDQTIALDSHPSLETDLRVKVKFKRLDVYPVEGINDDGFKFKKHTWVSVSVLKNEKALIRPLEFKTGEGIWLPTGFVYKVNVGNYYKKTLDYRNL